MASSRSSHRSLFEVLDASATLVAVSGTTSWKPATTTSAPPPCGASHGASAVGARSAGGPRPLTFHVPATTRRGSASVNSSRRRSSCSRIQRPASSARSSSVSARGGAPASPGNAAGAPPTAAGGGGAPPSPPPERPSLRGGGARLLRPDENHPMATCAGPGRSPPPTHTHSHTRARAPPHHRPRWHPPARGAPVGAAPRPAVAVGCGAVWCPPPPHPLPTPTTFAPRCTRRRHLFQRSKSAFEDAARVVWQHPDLLQLDGEIGLRLLRGLRTRTSALRHQRRVGAREPAWREAHTRGHSTPSPPAHAAPAFT